jgi:hypothetical protein
MKKKVWIFGDSYSDPKYITQKDWVTWPNQLAEKYEVTNWSCSGSGPDWSLDLLYKEIYSHNLDDLKNITLLFFKSHHYRFNLSFYEHPSHQALLLHLDNVKKVIPRHKKTVNKYRKYFKFYTQFLKYYAYNDNYRDIAATKIIGALKLYEPFFEKILVWPIIDNPTLTIYQTDKFYCVDNELYNIEPRSFFLSQDPRSNHLSKENHEIMLEQLSNWIEYNTPVDTTKFIFNVDQK